MKINNLKTNVHTAVARQTVQCDHPLPLLMPKSQHLHPFTVNPGSILPIRVMPESVKHTNIIRELQI